MAGMWTRCCGLRLSFSFWVRDKTETFLNFLETEAFDFGSEIETETFLETLHTSNTYFAQRLDLFAWCVRLSRLLVGFQMHFKSLHFHSSMFNDYQPITQRWPVQFTHLYFNNWKNITKVLDIISNSLTAITKSNRTTVSWCQKRG